MTLISALHFDITTHDPELCEIDTACLQEMLRSRLSTPTVYLLKDQDLTAVLVTANQVDKTLIRNRGTQNVTEKDGQKRTTRLAQTLGPVRHDCAQLLVYRYSGKLERGVRQFLKDLQRKARPRSHRYFLGTSPKIWDKIARRVTKMTPEQRVLRELEKVYIGRSSAAADVRSRIVKAARAELALAIMLRGETGSGKEVVAHAIHTVSGRKGLFLGVNCAAIPRSMAEDALFGHEDGSFTGAKRQTAGMFEKAHGGTLFLDEIGDMPLELQVMLLRVLQERRFCRVGGQTEIKVDVKVVAGTNKDLAAMVARGEFREELYNRLSGFWIETPRLAQHPEDLALHVVRIWQHKYGRAPLSPPVMQILRSWEWTGNVRELENTLGTLNAEIDAGVKITPDMMLRALRKQRPDPSPDASPLAVAPRRAALEEEVGRYRDVRIRYLLLEHTVRTITERIVKHLAPLTVVRSSTLSLARYAERFQRQGGAIAGDPLEVWHDLCGVRAVVDTQEHKQTLYTELSRFLEIVDTGAKRAGDVDLSRAGFRPLEYFVRIREGAVGELARRLDVDVPPEVLGFWGRLRLRTVFEELTLAIRDVVPQGVPLPAWWDEQLLALEGPLGRLQQHIGRIYASVRTWAGSYGAYMTDEEAREELAILETALACVPEDVSMAARAGKLAMILGDWDRTIAILEPYVDAKYPPALRDLAVALCKKYDPGTVPHQLGLGYFADACRLAPHDPDAFASFAGALKRAGQVQGARECYKRAVEIDGGDPYAFGGWLETRLMLEPDADVIGSLRDGIECVITRCRDRVAASVDLPWAYFDLGKYLGVLGQAEQSLAAYAEGIGCSNAPYMLEAALRAVETLIAFPRVPVGLKVARLMLAVGWCARFPSEAAGARLAAATQVQTHLRGPALIVVESGDEPTEGEIKEMGAVVARGLASFRGMVVVVGDSWAKEMMRGALRGTQVRLVDGASAIVGQDGHGVDLYPTLRPWADLVASIVRPSAVGFLMLGGDDRRMADGHLAFELGAKVGALDIGAAGDVGETDVVTLTDDAKLAAFVSTLG